MLFQAALSYVNATAMPDPVAAPATVPVEAVLGLPTRPPYGDRVSATLVALDAPAAESVTLDVFVLDERTAPDPNANEPVTAAILGARRFYRIATGVAVAGGSAVALAVPVGGPVYLRRTADTLTTARTLRVGVI